MSMKRDCRVASIRVHSIANENPHETDPEKGQREGTTKGASFTSCLKDWLLRLDSNQQPSG
jgi:hypothetical protein